MKTFITTFAGLLFMAQAAMATAADTAAGQPSASALGEAGRPAWALQVTPYVWATGLKGDVSPFRRGPTLPVEKSFSDVLSDLELAGFVNVWGRYGRVIVSGDLMYVDTSGAEGTGALPAMRLPGLGIPIPAGTEFGAKLRTKQFMATLMGGYRVVDTPGFTLDALGGARFWRISNEVTLKASVPTVGHWSGSYRESFNWLDPVIGARAFMRMTDQLSFQAQADIGGFGAGSDLTWSALATINYAFSDRLSASAGYKVLKVDYDRRGHVYNSRMSGPVLGITYRF